MPLLRRSDAAEEDLIDIWTYIAPRSLGAADALLHSLDSKSKSLARSPGIGAPRPDLGAGVRAFPVYPYLILYRETDGGILVLRYVHGARDLTSLPLEP